MRRARVRAAYRSDWVGVRFPTLAITPYTMNLVASGRAAAPLRIRGVNGQRTVRSAETGPVHATLGSGTVSFASINATAFNGTFTAQYKGMDVYVPWLDTDLNGQCDPAFGRRQAGGITFPFTSPPVSKTYGNFSASRRAI